MKIPAIPPAGYVNINQNHGSKKMRAHLSVTVISKNIIVIQTWVESFLEGASLFFKTCLSSFQ
jgi:hypothetical protein